MKKGDTITFDFNGSAPASAFPLAASTLKWQIKQLKQNGDLAGWVDVPGEGCELDYNTPTAGIFQVKAVLTPPGQAAQEFVYVRKKDVENATNGEGDFQDLHRAGAPDYFGVVDSDWQLNVLDNVVGSLGSTYYAEATSCEIYAGTYADARLSKCNIFVYHKCNDAGAVVPLIRDSLPYLNCLPPNAIDWNGTVIDCFGNENPVDESGNLVSNQREIPNWVSVSRSSMPQPGWVVARAQAWSTAEYPAADPWLYHSHVGIMDYDGSWVNAGSQTVNKYCHLKTDFYQPARFKRYNTP